ncbi:MAG: cytochrome c3 family protein [Anaerolineales bacterium]|jgi:predicted CXXCH cytochrome family protein
MHKRPNPIKVGNISLVGITIAVIFALGMLGVMLFPQPVNAKPVVESPVTGIQTPLLNHPSQETIEKEACLVCHQMEGMVLPLNNGEELYLTIDPEGFAQSVHGQLEFDCVTCHTNITGYPHPELSAVDRRAVSVMLTQVCTTCHVDQAAEYSEGQHAQKFAQGNLETALCVDCHTAHSVTDIRGSKVEIAKVCERCHSDIYNIYKDSVHGAALLEEGNTDVPTCSDCHENHDNTGPDDPGYVLFSPQICARCHADEDLMAKYGINTEVFQTYVADFHGTTVTIFEKVAPDQETNKPVCIDCHGVHDIRSPDDAASSVMKENLITTCQRCHPDAKPDFDDSWLAHYRPDLDNAPIVYLVNVFYSVVIPVTVGGMLIFIATDIFRTLAKKRKAKKSAAAESAAEEGESSDE